VALPPQSPLLLIRGKAIERIDITCSPQLILNQQHLAQCRVKQCRMFQEETRPVQPQTRPERPARRTECPNLPVLLQKQIGTKAI